MFPHVFLLRRAKSKKKEGTSTKSNIPVSLRSAAPPPGLADLRSFVTATHGQKHHNSSCLCSVLDATLIISTYLPKHEKVVTIRAIGAGPRSDFPSVHPVVQVVLSILTFKNSLGALTGGEGGKGGREGERDELGLLVYPPQLLRLRAGRQAGCPTSGTWVPPKVPAGLLACPRPAVTPVPLGYTSKVSFPAGWEFSIVASAQGPPFQPAYPQHLVRRDTTGVCACERASERD